MFFDAESILTVTDGAAVVALHFLDDIARVMAYFVCPRLVHDGYRSLVSLSSVAKLGVGVSKSRN